MRFNKELKTLRRLLGMGITGASGDWKPWGSMFLRTLLTSISKTSLRQLERETTTIIPLLTRRIEGEVCPIDLCKLFILLRLLFLCLFRMVFFLEQYCCYDLIWWRIFLYYLFSYQVSLLSCRHVVT